MSWSTELVGFAAGLLIAVVTAPVGVSGAVFLLPIQLSLQRRQPRRLVPCRFQVTFGDFYRQSSRLVTVSSVGQGGPSRSERRNSSPNRLPFGNWSAGSQRHAATIARTSTSQSR